MAAGFERFVLALFSFIDAGESNTGVVLAEIGSLRASDRGVFAFKILLLVYSVF